MESPVRLRSTGRWLQVGVALALIQDQLQTPAPRHVIRTRDWRSSRGLPASEVASRYVTPLIRVTEASCDISFAKRSAPDVTIHPARAKEFYDRQKITRGMMSPAENTRLGPPTAVSALGPRR